MAGECSNEQVFGPRDVACWVELERTSETRGTLLDVQAGDLAQRVPRPPPDMPEEVEEPQ